MRGIKSTKTALIFAAFFVVAAGQMTSALAQQVNLLPLTNTWKYMASTDAAFCLDGTGWQTVGYDDLAWPSGPGGFTGGETTAAILAFCTTRTLPAPTPNGRPQYFRTHFNVTSTAGMSLILSNRIDDQAVFYLNGTRVADYRHPDDPETCTPGGLGGDEATAWVVITLTPAQLAGIIQPNDNLLAVSVHQNATGSSDMVFAMTLTGETAFPATITDTTGLSNRTVVACSTTTLTVGASGSSPLTFQWIKDGADIDPAVNPTATNQSLVLNNIVLSDAGNYTVRVQNPLATVTSSPATVITVVPDTTPPTVTEAVGEPDLVTFVVTFSEPMDPNTVNDTFAYEIVASDGSEAPLGTSSITVPNPTQIIITSITPRNPNKAYTLIVNGDGSSTLTEACDSFPSPRNSVPANVRVVVKLSFEVLPLVGATWRYLDDSSDQGTAWTAPGFDDSTWPVGTTVFDWKNTGPRATVNGLAVGTTLNGLNPGTTRTTNVYFRTTFAMPGPTSGASMAINALVDGGYVLYLNGVEVQRLRVPDNQTVATYATGGPPDAGNDGDGDPVPYTLNVTNLQDGVNYLAAELHQDGDGSSDLDFALQVNILVTNLFTGPVSFTSQPQNQTVNEGQTAGFSVTVEGSQPITFQWQKSTGGGAFGDILGATSASLNIAGATPADNGNYRVVATNPSGPQTSSAATLTVNPELTRPTLVLAAGSTNASEVHLVFSRPISTTTGGSTANYQIVTVPGNTPLAVTSASVNGTNITLTTAPRVVGTSYRLTITGLRDTTFTGNLINPNPTIVDPLPQEFLLLGYMTSPWRYNTNCQDGINWSAAGFDDSSWLSGLGFFGFEAETNTLNTLPGGVNSIQTPLPVGAGVATNVPPIPPQIAYYFRASFEWPYDTSSTVFQLNHYIDDGAVFYLNGSASVVYNYTNAVPPNCTNLFSQPPGGDAVLVRTNLNGVATGHNVVAVEVHQSGTGSSDVLFGCELIARVTSFGAPRPRLTIAIEPNGTDARITWAPVQGTLQFKNNLDDLNWTDVSPGGTSGNVVVPVNQLRRFYSVHQ